MFRFQLNLAAALVAGLACFCQPFSAQDLSATQDLSPKQNRLATKEKDGRPAEPVRDANSGNKPDGIDFKADVVPILKKYCLACHNSEDREGELALDSSAALAKGGESGPVLFPGDGKSSRIVRVITGQLEPVMPPDDMEGPSQSELETLINWIDEGAKTPEGPLQLTKLTVPELESGVKVRPITDVTWSSDGKWIAVARYKTVEVLDANTKTMRFKLASSPGKINSIQFAPDSKSLLAATGVAGLKGTAIEWDLETRRVAAEFEGHSDVLYSAAFSPDGKLIATAGYDQKIILWDRQTRQALRSLTGHNDAIYDLEFSASGKVLASASGDQTVKLWQVATGKRLDTLGQPLQEQFATAFHPTKDLLIGVGRDNRIRVWDFVTKEQPGKNPLVVSRFAHEASIVAASFSADGKYLVTAAEDRTIKVWTGDTIELVASLPLQRELVYGLEVGPGPKQPLAIGRMDGTLDVVGLETVIDRFKEIEQAATRTGPNGSSTERPMPQDSASAGSPELEQVVETEPNESVVDAQKVAVGTTVSGVLNKHKTSSAQDRSKPASVDLADRDLFRFQAKAGQTLVLETNAARQKSPADTMIEILNADGDPVPRVLLQAVRDSYFTFRGKDANTSDDFRVHNWEEMELNEYLYCNGEVVKLFLYPRGPDSGFKVYPGFGSRHTFFDTTPIAHALQEPCYIVRAYPPGTPLVPNGLPVFTANFQNDDAARRDLGRDSRLFFTAPETGEFIVRVRDSRGFEGQDFKYQLTIRNAQPDFTPNFSLAKKKLLIRKGGGKEFMVSIRRKDGFSGPVEFRFLNPPPGFSFPKAVTVESGHLRAYGTIHAATDADSVSAEALGKMEIVAVARIRGKEVVRKLSNLAELKASDVPKVQLRITDADTKLNESQLGELFSEPATPYVLEIRPGQTVSARIVLKRNGHKGDVDFGKEDSGRNLPHGVFVDNIGLNGLRIIKGQGDTREFFVTAANWVQPQQRLFHLRANNVEGEVSIPVLLKVLPQ